MTFWYTAATLELNSSYVTKYEMLEMPTRLPIDQFERNVGGRMPSSR